MEWFIVQTHHAYEDPVDLRSDRLHHPDARWRARHAERVSYILEEGWLPRKLDEQTHLSSCST